MKVSSNTTMNVGESFVSMNNIYGTRKIQEMNSKPGSVAVVPLSFVKPPNDAAIGQVLWR